MFLLVTLEGSVYIPYSISLPNFYFFVVHATLNIAFWAYRSKSTIASGSDVYDLENQEMARIWAYSE
jgi:hypothetical protein